MSWDRRLYFLDERRPFGFLSFCFIFIFSEKHLTESDSFDDAFGN